MLPEIAKLRFFGDFYSAQKRLHVAEFNCFNQRHSFADEKRETLTAWKAHVAAILDAKEGYPSR